MYKTSITEVITGIFSLIIHRRKKKDLLFQYKCLILCEDEETSDLHFFLSQIYVTSHFSSVSQHHNNAEFLWRLAKATRNMSCIEEKHGNLEGKKTYIFEGN